MLSDCHGYSALGLSVILRSREHARMLKCMCINKNTSLRMLKKSEFAVSMPLKIGIIFDHTANQIVIIDSQMFYGFEFDLIE